MKIIPVSDLHLDINSIPRWYWEEFDSDAMLVLAGDASNSLASIDYIKNILCKRFKTVIMVAGNHEWYSRSNCHFKRDVVSGSKRYEFNVSYDKVKKNSPITRLKSHASQLRNLYILDNESLFIEGKHIYGGTLWFPLHKLSEDEQGLYPYLMNDAKYINYRIVIEQYEAFVANFPEQADLVVSHHLPSIEAFACSKDAESDYSPYYHANLSDELISRARYWVAGHQHKAVNTVIAGRTRFICNPKGVDSIFKNPLLTEVFYI